MILVRLLFCTLSIPGFVIYGLGLLAKLLMKKLKKVITSKNKSLKSNYMMFNSLSKLEKII